MAYGGWASLMRLMSTAMAVLLTHCFPRHATHGPIIILVCLIAQLDMVAGQDWRCACRGASYEHRFAHIECCVSSSWGNGCYGWISTCAPNPHCQPMCPGPPPPSSPPMPPPPPSPPPSPPPPSSPPSPPSPPGYDWRCGCHGSDWSYSGCSQAICYCGICTGAAHCYTPICQGPPPPSRPPPPPPPSSPCSADCSALYTGCADGDGSGCGWGCHFIICEGQSSSQCTASCNSRHENGLYYRNERIGCSATCTLYAPPKSPPPPSPPPASPSPPPPTPSPPPPRPSPPPPRPSPPPSPPPPSPSPPPP
eukprot:137314-Prymnesium_polylepis.1